MWESATSSKYVVYGGGDHSLDTSEWVYSCWCCIIFYIRTSRMRLYWNSQLRRVCLSSRLNSLLCNAMCSNWNLSCGIAYALLYMIYSETNLKIRQALTETNVLQTPEQLSSVDCTRVNSSYLPQIYWSVNILMIDCTNLKVNCPSESAMKVVVVMTSLLHIHWNSHSRYSEDVFSETHRSRQVSLFSRVRIVLMMMMMPRSWHQIDDERLWNTKQTEPAWKENEFIDIGNIQHPTDMQYHMCMR